MAADLVGLIREEPAGTTRKERAFRLALEGGIRSIEARLEWLDDAVERPL